jgi:hypothetical protein
MRLLPVVLVGAVTATPSISSAQQIRLPMAIESDFPLAQIFDYHIEDKAELAKQRKFVWGATGDTVGRDTYTTYYYPMDRDSDRQRNLEWYKEHQPEDVVYKCDRTTPAAYTYSWGAYVPVDISKESVRDYIFNRFLVPVIEKGFPAIGFDNGAINNPLGHCGIFRDGKWVQQYTGQHWDPVFADTVIDYFRWMRERLHARSTALILNFGIDPLHRKETERLLELLDVWVDERGFETGCGKRVVDDTWRLRAEVIAQFAVRKPYVSINQVCGEHILDDPEALSWITANFLLLRGPRSYLAITGYQRYGRLEPSLPFAPVGRPTGAMRETAGVWSREYERAIVVVNPSSSKKAAFQMPAGGFRLTDGSKWEGRMDVPARSGFILYRQ